MLLRALGSNLGNGPKSCVYYHKRTQNVILSKEFEKWAANFVMFCFQIGGQRCHDVNENQCLMPFYGSGPITGTVGSGFFSVSQYQNILRYAKKRHIKVIPEFDMPGHTHAGIY